jgi:hypothetical protein
VFTAHYIKETLFNAICLHYNNEKRLRTKEGEQKEKEEGTNVPYIPLDYFCLSNTKPPTRITTAAPTAPATMARVQSGPVVVVVVVVVSAS